MKIFESEMRCLVVLPEKGKLKRTDTKERTMLALINDPQIQKIINPPNVEPHWESDLKRLRSGDVTLDRRTAGENSIRAFQRLLIFLGYSTSSSGAFSIDGDFGRGTNRALAQFEFEHGLAKPNLNRNKLGYDCNWRSARKLIKIIPDVRLTVPTLEKMLEVAKKAIETKEVNCGSFDEAIFQLNALYNNQLLTCRKINHKYGAIAEKASQALKDARNIDIKPEWILSIIRQETAGVVRPRFEQHWLTKFNKKEPDVDFSELRYRSMSFGLGQIMGFNYNRVGAKSAKELYTAPLEKQIISIARFLTLSSRVRPVVKKMNPSDNDFKAVAKYYNGSGYASHHYDESLARWFREFKILRG
jgi:peptidoglycan hydrolase-like protein with peptidoglycan-binding domain